MNRWFSGRLLALVVSCAALIPTSTGTALAGIVCGLNATSSTGRDDFFRFCLTRNNRTTTHNPTYSNAFVAINRLWVPPVRDLKQHGRWWYCGNPWVHQLDVGENAAVIMPDYRDRRVAIPWMWIDNVWMDRVVAQTGTSWSRTAVFAHEFGHIYLGHLFNNNQQSTWQQEYDADVFAGRTLRRMGASLSEAQAICYAIAVPATSEDADSHPSLAFRLKAVREGWNLPSGSNSAVVANEYSGAITVEVEGRRYLIPARTSERVYFSDDVTTMLLWECPPGGCRWSDFAMPAGYTLRVLAFGRTTDLAVVAE